MAGRLSSLFGGADSPAPAPAQPSISSDALPSRPDGCLIWVLVDEPACAGPAPVIAQSFADLLEDDVNVLVTINDPAAAFTAPNVITAQTPSEDSTQIEAFLSHWSPEFGLVIGTPDTPKLLQSAASRGVTLFHASPTRSTGAQRHPAYLQHFHTCLAASATEAEALRQHLRGKPVSIETAGPLSDTITAPPCNEAECDTLAKLLGGRPVWLAAALDDAEVDMIESAHRKAFRSAHRLLLILVPRQLESAPDITARFEKDGWRVGLRSRGDEPDAEVQVYIADTTDEMGLWYRLAPSTFIGGTFLADATPSDPFEPASLGSAVLHGMHTGETPARFERLGSQGASILVSNAEELGEAVIMLLAPDKAASLAQAGWATTTESAHVIERLAELMLEVTDARDTA